MLFRGRRYGKCPKSKRHVPCGCFETWQAFPQTSRSYIGIQLLVRLDLFFSVCHTCMLARIYIYILHHIFSWFMFMMISTRVCFLYINFVLVVTMVCFACISRNDCARQQLACTRLTSIYTLSAFAIASGYRRYIQVCEIVIEIE